MYSSTVFFCLIRFRSVVICCIAKALNRSILKFVGVLKLCYSILFPNDLISVHLFQSPDNSSLSGFPLTRFELSAVNCIFSFLSNTKGRLWPHFQKRWKYNASRSIFEELRGFWKCCQTLSWVFDISSRWKLKLRWRSHIYSLSVLISFV